MKLLQSMLRKNLFALAALALIAVGCSKFRRIEKSEDWRVKYEAGLNYYAKKDYYRASILFESILPIVRGLPEGEKVEFNLAYCQYHEKLYLLASDQFKTFYETYGRSSLAEEASFMYAYCLYASSPDSNKDQQSSIEAMNAMQNFLNRYPGSQFLNQAVDVITVSQQKLEQKGFDNARHYLKLKMYEAAVISLDNFKKNFPDSKFLEESAYLKVQAEFELASISIVSKQLERFNTTLDYYKELVDNFPNSTFLKDAERYYTQSLERVNKLKNNKI
ncbi:MAG TPA: outer membrane protein assembly factor BamD [Cyclobacteriaceae bacterium]|nr:outer membrane protein assembly factor BamD [Cyclobacteriaceae bacterium]HNT51314.1 outer membrane protein assembly factor BamD [Cyclobacteriaceae bacterium]HRE67858.1 outer membrane protein assembly factor BamD [Cyclobacteriaceae bacterium]HRF33860.1 outer membrane protein assembly factor BamD [Cyclobacteriaceae bacterium]